MDHRGRVLRPRHRWRASPAARVLAARFTPGRGPGGRHRDPDHLERVAAASYWCAAATPGTVTPAGSAAAMTDRPNRPAGMPDPVVAPVNEGMWRAAAGHQLAVQRWAVRGRRQHPP